MTVVFIIVLYNMYLCQQYQLKFPIIYHLYDNLLSLLEHFRCHQSKRHLTIVIVCISLVIIHIYCGTFHVEQLDCAVYANVSELRLLKTRLGLNKSAG